MKTDPTNYSETAEPSRILALDGIRGIAILGVLVAHGLSPIQTEAHWANLFKAALSFGTYGVDLFFVLSGFLITGILFKNHGAGDLLKVFWIRRIVRIMPLYVGFLIAMYLICAFVVPDNMTKVPIWAYFLYLQNFFLASGISPNSFGFDITWSLVIEEHFYLIFPFLIAWAPRKYHLRIILAGCCIGLPMRLLVHPWLESHYDLVRLNSLFLTGRIDQLCGGACLAYMLHGRIPLSNRPFSPVFAIAAWMLVGILYALKIREHLITGIAGVLTLGTLIKGGCPAFVKFFESRVLRFFGRISYALYLFHSPVFWYFHHHLTGVASFFGVLLGAVLAIVFAWTSTRFFEEPLLAKARRYRYAKA